MSGSFSVSICNNTLLNFLISDIRRGGSAALRTQFSLMQRKIMQYDGSPLAQIGASGGSFPIVSCSKSWSWLLHNSGFGVVMSRICRTLLQIGASSIIISIMFIILITIIMIMIITWLWSRIWVWLWLWPWVSYHHWPSAFSSQAQGLRLHASWLWLWL